jgi:hypothetical protein
MAVEKKYSKQRMEEYAHEFGIHHSVQESDAKVDLTKYLVKKKEEEKKNRKNKKSEK